MALCVSAGAASTKLAAAAFTLMWTHSVQKTQWQEDWTVENGRLAITEARIEGLGAGMDAPEGSTFDGHWWRWRPTIAPVERTTSPQAIISVRPSSNSASGVLGSGTAPCWRSTSTTTGAVIAWRTAWFSWSMIGRGVRAGA